jgi:hypothetical protein
MAGGITNARQKIITATETDLGIVKVGSGMFNDNGLIGTVAEIIDAQFLSGVAAADFDLFPNKYNAIDFIFFDLSPATGGSNVHILMSDDGGATFKTGATDYRYSCVNVASGTANDTFLCTNSNGDSKILVATNLVSTSAQPSRFTVRVMGMRDPSQSGRAATIQAMGVRNTSASGPPTGMIQSYGKINSGSLTINAVRFSMSSGNFSCGYVMIGYRSV